MILDSWSILQPDNELQEMLSQALDIHPVTAQLLLNRNVADVDAARDYLSPALASLPDPFLLADMDVAVERIIRALEGEERIAVLGDYDVDGVTSVALLVRFFRSLGVTIDVHIPHRMDEGYGINIDALRKLKDGGAGLVITVDNGTRSITEIAMANDIGLDVVVTDHHEVGDGLPRAVAVVNPKRPDSAFPDRDLAGCGVAFMLMMALRRRLREKGMLPSPEPNLREHLDLVAIGTVADIVPLSGANRTLTKFGLAEVAHSAKPGVRALMEVSGLTDVSRGVRAGHVAFRLAPRINAAGRMGDAYAALECMTTDDAAVAAKLAGQLDRTNAERKVVEDRILKDALEQSDECGYDATNSALVVASSRWHPGVVGIVASKLAGVTGKPSAVIACDGGIARGSVRSAGGVDVVEALNRSKELLDRYGGHMQAAGFTLDVRRIEEFRERFGKACSDLAPADRRVELTVDAEVSADLINEQLVDELGALEPYGAGNAEPVLCTSSLNVVDGVIVGDNHLRLRLSDGQKNFTAIGFDMGDLRGRIDANPLIAFVPQYNTWNGQTTIQLKIKAILAKK